MGASEVRRRRESKKILQQLKAQSAHKYNIVKCAQRWSDLKPVV